MSSVRQKTGKIYGLDGLRTLAVFGVLLFHMFPRAVKGGYFGVILFFVISGFLTAYTDVRKGGEPVFTYYRKRLFRIYPALIIMLFITVEVIALTDKFKLLNVQEEVRSVLLAYNNYWQISKSADYFANLSANSAFTHLWYTSILIQFELLWPLLYRLFRLAGKNRVPFGILVLLSMLVMPAASFMKDISQSQLYYGTLSRIHALLIGAWLGWQRALSARAQTRSVKTLPMLVTALLFTAGSILIFRSAGGENPSVYHYGIVLYAVVSGAVVWLLSRADEKTGAVLDNPVCHFFSTYSYEIYLWQYPVLFTAGLLGRQEQYGLQIGILLLLSIWSHELVTSVQRWYGRRKAKKRKQ
ncbi:MAG: acyltransferase [Solobacterium sp.]|nr:acyltransferase [Solobacterium sp.]